MLPIPLADQAEKLAGLLAVALFAATGWGLGELLPAIRRLRPGVRHAYQYLLGLIWIAGGLYALSHCFQIPLRRPAIFSLAVLPVLAGIVIRLVRRSRVRTSSVAALDTLPNRATGQVRVVRALALLVGAAVTFAVLGEVVTQPLRDWDGRMTWAVKALYLRAAGTVDAEVLRGPEWFVSHSQYPVLMPVAQVVALELAGAGEDDPANRPLYAAFLPVFLALVWGGVRSGGSAVAAWYAVLAAALLPLLAFFPGGGANSAYSDLPLACFYGGALALLLAPRRELSAGIGAGLLLAATILTKEEGAPLALAALALTALTLAWRRAARARVAREGGGGRRAFLPLAVAAGIALAAFALLVSWRSGIPIRYHDDYRTMLAHQSLGGALARIPDLLVKIRYEQIALEHWGLFWSMAPLVLLAGRRGLRRRRTPALMLAFLAPLVLIFAAYLITDIPDQLPRMTWNRFLVQGGVPFLTLLGWALGDLLLRAKWLPTFLGGMRKPRSAR